MVRPDIAEARRQHAEDGERRLAQRDDFADYFRNSQLATLAQRQWSIDELSKEYSAYGPNQWGLTASDDENSYTPWGGPPTDKHRKSDDKIDGTITPAAPAGSLAFEPRLCLDDLEHLRAVYGDQAFLKYGFVDAFNPLKQWYDQAVLLGFNIQRNQCEVVCPRLILLHQLLKLREFRCATLASWEEESDENDFASQIPRVYDFVIIGRETEISERLAQIDLYPVV